MQFETRPEACSTIYGPVHSRRHGLSLGVNLGLEESKICTWGCVYCQCGMGERREILDSEIRKDAKEVLDLVRAGVAEHPNIDSITFAGNSEPSSHPDFLKIVQGVLDLRQSLNKKWIVNCLSNGSELDRDDVLKAFDLLDESWIKLDCGIDSLFQRLSRPIAKVGGVSDHVKRISKLKNISIQTLIWDCPTQPKLSNSSSDNLKALLEIFEKLRPKIIHLTTIARTPAVSQLEPVSEEFLNKFAIEVRSLGIEAKVYQ